MPDLGKKGLQFFGGKLSDRSLFFCAVLERHECRDAHDAKFLCKFWFIVNIHFAELDFRMFFNICIEYGGEQAARHAPAGPEIYQTSASKFSFVIVISIIVNLRINDDFSIAKAQ